MEEEVVLGDEEVVMLVIQVAEKIVIHIIVIVETKK
jgi:hypothetical protein